jgi:methionine-rich copper-binding protein CopC
MRHILRIVGVALFLLLMAVPVAGKLSLHADYARSEPAADEVLSTPPTEVKVWFTQELFRREGENWLHVTGPDGKRVDVEPATVDDNDRTLLTVSLVEGLADGAYRVEWRALSADDGHAEEDVFGFAIGTTTPAPAATPLPEATAAPQPIDEPPASSESGGLPCLGATPLVMLALGTVLVKRRKRSHLVRID